ncbi:MAG: DUF503 family protein [Candidatus Nanopelagicales bacterium]
MVRPLVAHLAKGIRGDGGRGRGTWTWWARTQLAVATVAPDLRHCQDVLDTCERWLADEPHVQFVEARRTYVSDEELG